VHQPAGADYRNGYSTWIRNARTVVQTPAKDFYHNFLNSCEFSHYAQGFCQPYDKSPVRLETWISTPKKKSNKHCEKEILIHSWINWKQPTPYNKPKYYYLLQMDEEDPSIIVTHLLVPHPPKQYQPYGCTSNTVAPMIQTLGANFRRKAEWRNKVTSATTMPVYFPRPFRRRRGLDTKRF
jgi:hypothetical protein